MCSRSRPTGPSGPRSPHPAPTPRAPFRRSCARSTTTAHPWPSAPPRSSSTRPRWPTSNGSRRWQGPPRGKLGLPDPLLYLTTAEEPGRAQAAEALEKGASVVVAAGGDGTVREVARALVNTGTPMGLIPSGTGNLLARNLNLPLDTISSLVQTALSGRDMGIDAGWLRVVPPPMVPPPSFPTSAAGDPPAGSDHPVDDAERPAAGAAPEPKEHLFLVMAGIGFDAATMADTDEGLKRRIGWVAYLLRAVRHLGARKTRLAMKVGNGAWRTYRVRTLLFANCGRLPAGIVLLPDAEIDDGYLDIAAVDTRGWLFGWVSLVWRVMLQGLGWRREMPYDAASIDFLRGRTATVALDQAEPVQVDGDVVGDAVELHIRVAESGLVVRVRR
ncbi:diacylglycerol/lipid kinase family protein [Salana multivorans]